MIFNSGYNTYIAAAGLIATAAAGFLSGEATLGEAIMVFLNGLGLAGLRYSNEKIEKKIETT